MKRTTPPDKKRRTRHLRVVCSESEARQLMAAAKRNGSSFSLWARVALLREAREKS